MKKARLLSMLIAALAIGIAAAAPARAAENELVFGGFGGSFEKAIKATVIPMFEKKFNAKVIYVTGTSAQLNAKILANPQNPGIDMWGARLNYRL